MFQGKLLAIAIAPASSAPLTTVDEIDVTAGKGLSGDRFAEGRAKSQKGVVQPRQHVSLIESEAIEAAVRDYRLEISHPDTRRNLLTRDVPLNHLVGREFTVGDVLLRGVELCEPCGYLESLTCEGIEAALQHRGGLRAEVLRGGLLRVGDEILPQGS